MTTTEHDTDAGLADFLAAWRVINSRDRRNWGTVTYAVIGLTNFGERPVAITRLAEVLGRPVNEAEALARQWGWPGTRVEDGLITVNPGRPRSASRRQVQVGDRRFGVTGCGFDIFLYAPLVRPGLHLEETCTVTGTPIRIAFTPGRVEHVEPAGAVVSMPSSQGVQAEAKEAGGIEEIDANLCAQAPLYSSAEAAQGWLAAHPGGRVFPVREAWDLSVLRDWRDRMSALLNPGH
jgi:alkylmercury lyase